MGKAQRAHQPVQQHGHAALCPSYKIYGTRFTLHSAN
jgi:hypothetical protein